MESEHAAGDARQQQKTRYHKTNITMQHDKKLAGRRHGDSLVDYLLAWDAALKRIAASAEMTTNADANVFHLNERSRRKASRPGPTGCGRAGKSAFLSPLSFA
jgi:hypothetical protein